MQTPIQEELLFVTEYGSRLYGTAGPSSDRDIRGIFWPTKESLLLGHMPKHYVCQAEVTDGVTTDSQYLAVHYWFELITQGETNALDIFFGYTNPETILLIGPRMRELIAHKDKFITANVMKYLGYCKAQALKYSIKGDRIQNLEALRDFCNRAVRHYALSAALAELGIPPKTWTGDKMSPYVKNNKIIGQRLRIENKIFGEHAYVLFCDNNENFLMVSDHKFPLEGSIGATIGAVEKCLKGYGKRAFEAAQDSGADYKALSHALRVSYQAMELLSTGEIHFPLRQPQLDLVRSVKFKTTDLSYDQIVGKIEENIALIETEYIPKTQLPKHANWNWINEFLLRHYNKEQSNVAKETTV